MPKMPRKKKLPPLESLQHPIQPVGLDEHGVARFKRNPIVVKLMEHGRKTGCDLNDIAGMGFSNEDFSHFDQLIGYSVSGYGDLSYVDRVQLEAIDLSVANNTDPRDELIEVLKAKLKNVKDTLRECMADLFSIHPDDLK